MGYGTVTGWISYAAARGQTVADDPASAAALQRAADHIRFAWVEQFLPGYDADSANVEEATYEAATLELATPGLFAGTFTPAQQKVLTEVKGIKWTPITGTDSDDAFANATPTSIKIAAMLSRYMPGKLNVSIKAVG
jgi:hypothetical protein